MPIATFGGPLTVLVQVEGYRSAVGSFSITVGHGVISHGTLSMVGTPTEATVTLNYSDTGYRSRSTDVGGVKSYRPDLEESLAIDRKLSLNPDSPWAAVAWGQVRIRLSPELSALINEYNSDGRDIRLYLIRKTWDADRLIFTDPPFTDAQLMFKGLAGPWRMSEYHLVVPTRDASYWLDRPVQQALYDGTGSYGGTDDLLGKPIPRARGGTSGNPIRNVRPVLVDPATLIYQYTDGPGTVVNLYEGGYAGTPFQANTTNLYSGSTTAGQYRTDNSRGLFQLGTIPTREITADVTGQFPVAGAHNILSSVLRFSLSEDMQVPLSLLDLTSIAAVTSAYPYVSGYWIGTEEMSGFQLASYLMESMGAYLIPNRNGTLRFWVLRALAGTETPAAILSDAHIASMTRTPLQAPLEPPPYRWRVGYQRNHFVQTGDLSSLITSARKLTISQQEKLGIWASTSILTNYRRPSDPSIIGGALLVKADSEAVAAGLGALYSTGLGSYQVALPLSIAVNLDIGSVLNITYPIERFRTGRLVQVIGESLRVSEGLATIEVFG